MQATRGTIWTPARVKHELEALSNLHFFRLLTHGLTNGMLQIEGVLSFTQEETGRIYSLKVRLEYPREYPWAVPSVFDQDKQFRPSANGHQFPDYRLCLSFPEREEFGLASEQLSSEVLGAALIWLEHIQAIANTAVFHIPTVEQGGGSLRLALAQRATSVEVLRLLISMGPIELMHFQTLSGTSGNAPPLTDPTNGLRFPDLNNGVDPNTGARGAAVRQMFQTNLIMPEPCPFISTTLPACSVVRPTNTTGVATGALKFLTAMGLFIGQSPEFFSFLTSLATAADAAQREV